MNTNSNESKIVSGETMSGKELEVQMEKKEIRESDNDTNEEENEEKKIDLFQALEKLMQEKRIYKDNLLTKDKVAELLGRNRTYLSQIINEQAGKTFTQYINDLRIQDAVRQLSNPENQIPLKALSVELGFNSPTTFYKQFQSVTGMTPAQYRNQMVEMHNN